MNTNSTASLAVTPRPAVYLEMVAPQGKALVIQPTPLGRRQLNNFWREWLSDLLLSSPVQYKVAISYHKNSVTIRPRHGSIEGIAVEVMKAAEVIHPLRVFTRRIGHNTRVMSFEVDCQLTSSQVEAIEKIRLPYAKIQRHATLGNDGWYGGLFEINRSQSRCPLSIGELGRMFEYKFALIARQ